MPKAGGEAVMIETGGEATSREGTLIGGAFEIRVDAEAIYWLEMNVVTSPMSGNLVRKRKTGAPREVLATAGLPDNLELDACNVYWTGQGDHETSIYRLGK
jgi:hypothetical protein